MKGRWMGWRLWTCWQARQDRKHNLPHPDSKVLGPTEGQILQAANSDVHDLEQTWRREREPLGARLDALRQREKETEQEWKRLTTEAGRTEPRVHLSHTSHILLLGVLTLGEFAFNLVVFNVMRQPGPMTLVMALSIGIAIPLCAWYVGILLRQWPKPGWVTAAKLAVALGALGGVMWGINSVRVRYLAERSAEIALAHAELTPAFYMVNLVVLLGAILATYFAKDPVQGFLELYRLRKRLRRELTEAEGHLEQLDRVTEARRQQIGDTAWALMQYYRMHNRRGRDEVPKYFDNEGESGYRPAIATFSTAPSAWAQQREARKAAPPPSPADGSRPAAAPEQIGPAEQASHPAGHGKARAVAAAEGAPRGASTAEPAIQHHQSWNGEEGGGNARS